LTYVERQKRYQPDYERLQRLPIALVLMAFAALSVASIIFSDDAPWVIVLPLVALGLVVGGSIIIRAVQGSTTAIITYLVLVLFITDAQFRARGAGAIDTDWQSLLKFGLWIGAGVIGFAHMPPIRTVFSHVGSASWLGYIVIAMISSVYALTPAYSFAGAFSLLCFFVFAIALINKLSESQFLWTVVLTLAAFLAVGWVVYIANPAFGSSPFATYNGLELRFCGIAGQANNMGSVCAKYLGAIFLLWVSGRGRWYVFLPLIALGIASLVASDARTGMIAVVVAIAAATLARSTKSLIAAVLVAMTAVIGSLIFSFHLDALGSHFSRSGDPTEVFTLTGRTEIWDFVGEKIKEQPLFGWGYNASKVLLPQHVGFSNDLMVDTAHNMLLQSLLSVGFVGTFPIVIVMFCLFFDLLYRPYRLRDLFFVIIFISGISDTSALGTTPSILTLLFLMISVMPRVDTRNRPVANVVVNRGASPMLIPTEVGAGLPALRVEGGMPALR
jgi:O-antigen ligase